MSELQVTLARDTFIHGRLLGHLTDCRNGEEKGYNAVHEWIEVEHIVLDHKTINWQLFSWRAYYRLLWGCDGGEWYMRRCRSMSSSRKDIFNQYTWFFSKIQCPNNVKMHLDSSLCTHTIASWQVFQKSCTSINFFRTWVLPLSLDHYYPPSPICELFHRSLIVNLPWITESIRHLHSARHGECFAPSQHPPTLIAWFMVVTFGQVLILHELCILRRYEPRDVIAGYKKYSKDQWVRYYCRACF